MRWSVGLVLSAAVLTALAGCRHSSCDQVESELRAREEDVRILRENLHKATFQNHLLQRQLISQADLPGPDGMVYPPSEPYPVRSIRLGRQTGGRPSESLPGDDALQVLLEPIDPQGQAIKAPGTLTLQVIEVNAEGLKRPLSVWDIPPEELREKWQNGLFTTGYTLTLPWKIWPSTEKLRVIALFRMLDGRVFEADRDITVRVLPENKRRLEQSKDPGTSKQPEQIPTMPRPEPTTPPVPDSKKVMPPATDDKNPPPPDPPPSPDGPSLLHRLDPSPGIRLLRPVKMQMD